MGWLLWSIVRHLLSVRSSVVEPPYWGLLFVLFSSVFVFSISLFILWKCGEVIVSSCICDVFYERFVILYFGYYYYLWNPLFAGVLIIFSSSMVYRRTLNLFVTIVVFGVASSSVLLRYTDHFIFTLIEFIHSWFRLACSCLRVVRCQLGGCLLTVHIRCISIGWIIQWEDPNDRVCSLEATDTLECFKIECATDILKTCWVHSVRSLNIL